MEFKVFKKNIPNMGGEINRVTDQLALGIWQWLEGKFFIVGLPASSF